MYDESIIADLILKRNYKGCFDYLSNIFNENNISWDYIIKNHKDHRWLLTNILEVMYYTSNMSLGTQISDLIFLNAWLGNQPMYNFRKIIPRLSKLKIQDNVSDYKEWYPCNPSICQTYDKKGYFILQRLVNFSSERATNYVSHSEDRLFKTRNILMTTDSNFKILSQVEVKDESNRIIYPKHVQGLEDMQIFHINEKKRKHKRLGFFCTLVDCQPSGIPQIGFGLLTISNGVVSKVHTLDSGDKNRCEKNWLPYYDNGLKLLYSGSNMERYRFKVDDPMLHLEGKSEYCNKLRDVRGSGSPIPFDGGFLILFHEVIFMEDKGTYKRTYIHRFVKTDRLFQVLQISNFFTFENCDIEFARSIIWDLEMCNILIGVGIEDHNSYLYTIDPNVIRDLLIF